MEGPNHHTGLQIVASVDVRGPVEFVDGVAIVARFRAHGDRRPQFVVLRPRLCRLRHQAHQAVRRSRSVIPQRHRGAVVRLPLWLPQEVWSPEISVLR
ncbi:hypothetical protein U1Q18_000376 [Sarracenia purpurea var. burkii]